MVRIQQHTGWIEVKPDLEKNVMRVYASLSLAKVIPALLLWVTHLFDLSCDPLHIALWVGPLAQTRPGLRVPGAFDGFEIAVRAILGQQVSVAAARTLAGRFAATFGSPVESPFAALVNAFPCAEEIAAVELDSIVALGILRSRALTIQALAKALAAGELTLTPASDVESTVGKLQSIAGIGPWTAQYIAMRALGWPDAFPHTDLGLMKALGERNPKQVLARAEVWRPWRSYAVMHLWTGGSDGTIR
ncbi:MAG: AlkA N-terminal domain-containing protein [Bryobacteraceae bacterium]